MGFTRRRGWAYAGFAPPAEEEEEFEHYDSPTVDHLEAIYGTNWSAQTFTPQLAHSILKVIVPMSRIGTPGILDVEITTTVGGEPDTTLCSGSTDGDTLPILNGAAEYREISLGAGATLSSGVKYAIVLHADAGSNFLDPNWVVVGCDDDAYSRGEYLISANGGGDWSPPNGWDMLFAVWGIRS